MEIEHAELFASFLRQHLKTAPQDIDAYLEQLIIHWGETGEETFSLHPEETVSGKAETIAFSVKNRYFIRENGQETPVEDLSEGYDLYRPVLEFTSDQSTTPAAVPPPAHLNPIGLIRYKSGQTLKSVAAASGIRAETLLEYEKPGYPIASIPLGEAAALAKALNVHAEDLLSLAPTAPRGR